MWVSSGGSGQHGCTFLYLHVSLDCILIHHTLHARKPVRCYRPQVPCGFLEVHAPASLDYNIQPVRSVTSLGVLSPHLAAVQHH